MDISPLYLFYTHLTIVFEGNPKNQTGFVYYQQTHGHIIILPYLSHKFNSIILLTLPLKLF